MSTSLSTLPPELQQLIYAKLPVRDRARFAMALPKDHGVRVRPSREERKLSIISRSLKTRRLKEVTPRIMEFLKHCTTRDDPTVAEICESFPQVGEFFSDPRDADASAKIFDNTLEEEDLERLPEFEVCATRGPSGDIWTALYTATPKTFDLMWTKESYRRAIQDRFEVHYYFNLHNYHNGALLQHVHDVHLAVDLSSAKRYFKGQCNNLILRNCSHAQLILRHNEFTVEELEAFWTDCMKNMVIDVAETINEYILRQRDAE